MIQLLAFILGKMLGGIARVFFRVRVQGVSNVPRNEGALVVSNHVSFLDVFVLCAAIPRVVGFVTIQKVYDHPLLNWFFRRVHIVPIKGGRSKEALDFFNQQCQYYLNRGKVMCIFAEGQISRNGHLLGFKRGLEHIAKGTNAPVIPVHIDGLVGTFLSYNRQEGKTQGLRWKMKREKVYVNIGKPLTSGVSAFQVRQAIKELEAENFHNHRSKKSYLVKQLNHLQKPFSSKKWNGVSYVPLFEDLVELEFHLFPVVSAVETVGVMVADELEAIKLNWALTRMGKRVWNIDTQSKITFHHPEKPKVIITDQPFWISGAHVFSLSEIRRNKGGLVNYPGELFGQEGLADFSTAEGVVTYTNANFMAEFESLQLLFDLDEEVKMACGYPLHSPMGYFLKVWLPLLTGMHIQLGNSLKEANCLVGPQHFIRHHLVEFGSEKIKHVVSTDGTFWSDLKDALKHVQIFQGLELGPHFPWVAVNSPDFQGKGIDGRPLFQVGTVSSTVGRPLPGIAAKVVNAHGELASPGEQGWLCLKGAHFPHQGWLNSGQQALMDQEGFIALASSVSQPRPRQAS